MAKKGSKITRKQVLTEWQKRNSRIFEKKETEDSRRDLTKKKVVHSEGAASQMRANYQ